MRSVKHLLMLEYLGNMIDAEVLSVQLDSASRSRTLEILDDIKALEIRNGYLAEFLSPDDIRF